MNREEIYQLLQRLNDKLSKVNETRELVVCGGAALILSNIRREETMDIDLLSPDKDELLQRLSVEIAEELKVARLDWLNSNVTAFFRDDTLPMGWEERLQIQFQESHLIVKALSPQDILVTKICAHIDREMDEGDIKELAKTKEDFEKAVGQIGNLPRYQDEEAEIIIEELRIRLGFNDDE